MGFEKELNYENLDYCQKQIMYEFQNKSLLLEALTHPSLRDANSRTYQRLEFLGDAILSQFTCKKLFLSFPHYQENLLTKARSNIVSQKTLATVSNHLNLKECILRVKSVSLTDSILSDVYESIVAAIFLDGGSKASDNFMEETLGHLFSDPLNLQINYKALLLEWAAQNKIDNIAFILNETNGLDHKLIFKMELRVKETRFGPVSAKTKKEAEQALAKLAVEQFAIPIC